ncbi:hypothetical protein NVP1005O_57 [Vibrio phage 1.005.O._10N.286.48.F2]|nr:hypothetical protein NVP1005O_57 [Vibrio phage 1.005.O._10N.286.48.F2]
MSQEKHYDYFKYENKELQPKYNEEVGSKRTESLRKMLEGSGALAYTNSSSWGGVETVGELVYPYDTELKSLPHVMNIRSDYYDGQKIVVLRGKLNSKAGKDFNKWIDQARDEIKDLPDFKAWVIKSLDVGRTGLGGAHESGRGTAMLSTDFGMRDGVYLFRIPKDSCDGISGTNEVPEGFESISYGQWYDIVEGWE